MFDPPTAAPDTMWMADGLCRKVGPADAWFPEKMDADAQAVAESARDICQMCPVKKPCLEWALAGGEQFGIWGGINLGHLKPIDLRRMRTERGLTLSENSQWSWPHGTEAGHRRHIRAGQQPCGLCMIGRNVDRGSRRHGGGVR